MSESLELFVDKMMDTTANMFNNFPNTVPGRNEHSGGPSVTGTSDNVDQPNSIEQTSSKDNMKLNPGLSSKDPNAMILDSKTTTENPSENLANDTDRDVVYQNHESLPNVDLSVNVSTTREENTGSDLLCRLCGVPCQNLSPVFIFQSPPHNPEVMPKEVDDYSGEAEIGDILLMIKQTLPIKVSCCDRLPKQVCKVCVEKLKLSYTFTSDVLKAESHLKSLRTNQNAGDGIGKINLNSMVYDCPSCKEMPLLLAKSSSLIKSCSWEKIIIKDEPEDSIEPSHEELEKSYNDLFGGHQDFGTFKTEERLTLRPSKPICRGGRRPRGRPRSRPLKVTPRGRRGRHCVQTTVAKILELSDVSYDNNDYGFRVRSRENNPAEEALTQCLLCERWLPGSAACLQHSLFEHLDCAAFLCPRCPRDDFPGDFELIQHYQESHCPDLELFEVLQADKSDARRHTQPEISNSFQHVTQVEAVPDREHEMSVTSNVTENGQSRHADTAWPVETMDYDTLNNTPPNEFYESQDEVSSNLSELPPRSLTSHSALYEEESNSLSTHGSDSNLATEDNISGNMPAAQILHDKMIGESSSLGDEVSFSNSSCALGVEDFTSELGAMEEESQDNNKLMDKPSFHDNQDSNNIIAGDKASQRNDYKLLQEDSQGSQDSLKMDDLCGFQEAISEKNQEVNLNGSVNQIDCDMTSPAEHNDLNAL